MTTCPTPLKARYTSAAEARRAAATIRCDLRGPALEPYPCGCGVWHLKSEKSLTARIRGALKKG